ncbi:MAG: type II toxin-antitoxin system VapC family toxin [Bacteroidota bacterium]
MILIDTDIAIDVLRSFPNAIAWLHTLNEEIAISGFTAMELVQGCDNKTEQRAVEKFLKSVVVLWLEPDSGQQALAIFAKYHLSHKVGLIDALIAQTAIDVKADLHTFNVKHYAPIALLKTIQPYKK